LRDVQLFSCNNKATSEHNANPNACTNENQTPLHFICASFNDTLIAEEAQKRIEIVRLLLAAGANPNAEYSSGFTPLLFQVLLVTKYCTLNTRLLSVS